MAGKRARSLPPNPQRPASLPPAGTGTSSQTALGASPFTPLNLGAAAATGAAIVGGIAAYKNKEPAWEDQSIIDAREDAARKRWQAVIDQRPPLPLDGSGKPKFTFFRDLTTTAKNHGEPLTSYTASPAGMNRYLRGFEVPDPEATKTGIKRLTDALDALPPTSGEFHRDVNVGLKGDLAVTPAFRAHLKGLKPGDVFSDPAFMSSNMQHGEGFLGLLNPDNVVTLKIKGHSARNISAFSSLMAGEQEALFKPGVKLNVVHNESTPNGKTVVHLVEEGYQAPKMADDSFTMRRAGDPPKAGALTLSSDRNLNKLLTTTGTSGDNVGMGLRGNKQPAIPSVGVPTPVDPPSPAKIPKAIAALQRKVGEKLLTDKQLTTLGNRGEYVGVGNNPTPIKPSHPALVKLGSMLDFMKKGIYSREVFQSEVQRAGLQPQLQRIRGIGDTLFNNRGGGAVYSGTMQQSAQMKGSPRNLPPSPSSTQVLGEAGFTTDSFAVNQPSRTGQPPQYALTRDLQINMGLAKGQGFAGDSNVSSGLSRPPGLDSATKAMGYKLQTPQQTGLPWNVAADPKTGEMLTLKGKPLPPLVGPSFPTHQHTPAPVPASSSAKAQSFFQQGFTASVGTADNTQPQSFFQRTPELTEGMNLRQRMQFAIGRLGGDLASDASRQKYWRWNNVYAIAHGVGGKVAGESKVGAALAGTAAVYALGQAGGQFDLTNPGQAFRPKGFSAAFPVNDADKRQTDNGLGGLFGAKELVGRYVIGRSGNLLPYEQFKQERPGVSKEQYDYYAQYLKGGGGRGAMPESSFDVGGLGLVKGTAKGINGPEVRLGGISVNTPAAVASVGATTAVGAVFNPQIRPFAGKALGSALSGYDFYQRLQKGESASQAALGTAIGIEGGFKGGLLGAKLAPNNPIAKGIGLVIGGGLGAIGASSAFDAITNIGKDARIAEAARREVAIQKGGIGGFAASVAKFTSDPVGYIKEGLQGGKGTIANKAAGDQAMSTATDQLLKASANYKLQRQPDGSVKSVTNDTGTNVRGEVQKIDDGDTYKIRVFNKDTREYETQNVRLQGADTRETADHGNKPGFTNHMIGKQIKDQGYADAGAVFAQGEKDKQAAERLIPVGSAVYLNGTETAKHNRPARDVGTETGAKDVAGKLIESDHAKKYEKPASSGKSDETSARVARLQYGAAAPPEQRAAALAKQMKATAERDRAYADPNVSAEARSGKDQAMKDATEAYTAAQGGQGDRNLESKERQTTQTNQTKLQNTDLQGRYKIANTQESNQGRLENTDLQGRYKIANTQEQNKGRLQHTDLTGRYKLANTGLQNQGKLQVADLTSGRKLQGDVYKANVGYTGKVDSATINADGKVRTAGVTGGYKVAQEGVKQSGAANVAGIKAGATLGAAGLAAGAKVDSAKIALQGTAYKADATVKVASIKSSSVTDAAQAKAESEGSKAAASFAANLNKSTANSMATEDKARIARYRSLGIY